MDDLFVSGYDKSVESTVVMIEREFNIRRTEDVKEFIGCQFERNKDGKSVIFHQKRIVDKVLKCFWG